MLNLSDNFLLFSHWLRRCLSTTATGPRETVSQSVSREVTTTAIGSGDRTDGEWKGEQPLIEAPA